MVKTRVRTGQVSSGQVRLGINRITGGCCTPFFPLSLSLPELVDVQQLLLVCRRVVGVERLSWLETMTMMTLYRSYQI